MTSHAAKACRTEALLNARGLWDWDAKWGVPAQRDGLKVAADMRYRITAHTLIGLNKAYAQFTSASREQQGYSQDLRLSHGIGTGYIGPWVATVDMICPSLSKSEPSKRVKEVSTRSKRMEYRMQLAWVFPNHSTVALAASKGERCASHAAPMSNGAHL